jgi:hypothetical protein
LTKTLVILVTKLIKPCYYFIFIDFTSSAKCYFFHTNICGGFGNEHHWNAIFGKNNIASTSIYLLWWQLHNHYKSTGQHLDKSAIPGCRQEIYCQLIQEERSYTCSTTILTYFFF